MYLMGRFAIHTITFIGGHVLPTRQGHFRNFLNTNSAERPPRRLSQNSSSSDDWNSSTDNVLEDTRRRLGTLELESMDVDRRYRHFRFRHLERTNKINGNRTPGT